MFENSWMRRALLALWAVVSMQLPARALAADTEPPVITHTAVTDAALGEPLTIRATITDESEIFEPTLYYRQVGAKKYLTASLSKDGSTYQATIPASAVKSDLEYFIEAYDAVGNGPARFASDTLPQQVKVGIPAAPPPPPPPPVAAPAPIPETPKPAPVPAVAVVAAPEASAPAPEIAARPSDEPRSPGSTALAIAGCSTAAVGVASLVVGAVFWSGAKSNIQKAQDAAVANAAAAYQSDAQAGARRANVALIAGGVLAGVGVVMAVIPLFRSHSADPAPAADQSEKNPEASLGSDGAIVTMRF